MLFFVSKKSFLLSYFHKFYVRWRCVYYYLTTARALARANFFDL